MKRFSVIILLLSLIFGSTCISVPVFAYDDDTAYPVLYESDAVSATEALSEYVDTVELRAYLFNAFKECPEGRVDISQFNLPPTVIDNLRQFIWREMPECFHINSIRSYKTSKMLTALEVTYKYAENKEQYLSMITACEERAAVLLDGIIGNDSLSDVEKALFIHDRLAVNCNYCYDTSIGERYTMYGALVLGLAVCDGYTHAYSYLLRLAGIESVDCSSEALEHSWNLVLIDGNYYHVDVTWDDPTIASKSRTYEGAVGHNYFMLSNKAIKNNKHNASDYYTPANANDTQYDNYFWKCSKTEFQLVQGEIYYFDNESSKLNRLNDDGKSGTVLHTVVDTWWSPDRTYYFTDNYTRLSSDEDSLYYSTSDTIYSFDLNRNRARAVFRPELENGNPIFGFTYSDGYFIYDTNEAPSGKYAHLKQSKQPYTPEGIAATLTYSADMAGTQEVYADVIANKGISGYYFGQSSEHTLIDVVLTNEYSFEFTVEEPGTYYFVAYDKLGNSSKPVSLTFCLVTLHTNGGTVECDKILTEKNNAFFLPEPEMEDMCFAGWSDNQDGNDAKLAYEITDPPLTSDYYAQWTEAKTETECAVGTIGDIPVTLTITNENGEVIATAEAVNGVFVISVGNEPAYIEFTAPDHIGKIFRADQFTGGLLDIKLDLVGDANLDGERNNKDVAALFRAVSGGNVEYNDAADVNGDGEENNKDVAILFRSLSDPNQTLVTHSAVMYS